MSMKFLWVGILLSLPAVPAQAQNTGLDARVDLRVEQRPLGRVIESLRTRTGANIVVTDEASEKIVESLELTKIEWREALDLAAENAGCVVEERPGGVLMVSVQQPVTIELVNRELTEVIDIIGKLGGANIVWAPEVAGTVSLRLKDVPWRHALDVAVKTLGYVIVEEGRGILRVVDPVTLQAQMETHSYQLRFLRPRSQFRPNIKSEFLQPLQNQNQGTQDILEKFSVLKALEKALSPGGELDYIETSNVVIARDTPQVHRAIQDMLTRLDIEPASVFVDVKFVSTLNGDLLNLGVDYGDGGPTVSMQWGSVPINLPFNIGAGLDGDGGWEDSIVVGGGPAEDPFFNVTGVDAIVPPTVFGQLSFLGIQPTLKMLQRDTKSEVIQAPKIIALDGHEATIFVGETVRYAEAKSEQGQAGGLQLSLAEADASPVEVGFQLMIVPHVIPGTNTLTMEVIPKETSLSGVGSTALAPPGFDVFTIGAAGLEGSIALPRTRSSTIITTMLLESGQTGVIGGLTTDSDTEIETRVPYLSRIPLLGELFKHKTNDRQRRSLLVFLTPTIVHSSVDTERILQQELSRRSDEFRAELERILYLDEKPPEVEGWQFEDSPAEPPPPAVESGESVESLPPAETTGG